MLVDRKHKAKVLFRTYSITSYIPLLDDTASIQEIFEERGGDVDPIVSHKLR